MRRIYNLPQISRVMLTFILGIISFGSNAQLTGTKSIPVDYTSITAFVNALNINGVGAGGVILNVPSGYTETLTGRLEITATGTATNPITIQKSGVGANPELTAYVGTALTTDPSKDGMMSLSGTDYLTIDGINFVGSAANTTDLTRMEYAIGLFKVDGTNGCQYNTIKNCTIILDRSSNTAWTGVGHNGSTGIVVLNCTSLLSTALTTTTAAGSNSFNTFKSNSISNVNAGIVFVGFVAATPFNLGDASNIVGGSSTADGNTILNFGGAASATLPSTGIFASNQWDMNCSFNTVNNNNGSGVNHVSTLRGIYFNLAVSANLNCNNNNVTIHGGGTTSQVSCIENSFGSTAAGNTVNLNNNTITGSYLSATTGVYYGVYNLSSAANVNMLNNNVSGITYGVIANTGTGAIYAIYNTGATANLQIRNNVVNNISRIGSTGGTIIGIYASSGTIQTLKNNTVSNLSIDGTGTTSTMYGIQTATGTIVIDSNTIFNLNCLKTTGSSTMYGIYNIGSPTNENYNYNTIYNLNHQGTGTVYGAYFSTAAGTRTFSNNLIHTLFTNGNIIAGINSLNSSPNIFNNKVYNVEGAGAAPTVSGLIVGSVGTSSTANVFNNVIGDLKAPNASSASNIAPSVRGINVTVSTTLSNINVVYNTVYLNASSLGANFTTTALFHTGNATSTTANLTIGNNIFHNVSTPQGTGITAAFIRGISTATNLNAASNRNDFYPGLSSSTRLIYFDGTNSVQTIGAYQTLFPGIGANSVSTLPNYLSTTGSASSFLRINPAIATLLESGGASIASIPTDIDGQIRFGSAGYTGTGAGTDIGADEFEGTIPGDIDPPVISALSATPGPSCNVVSHAVTVTITDNVGVTNAQISYAFGGVSQTPITMTLTSGTSTNGTYSATIPAASGPNVTVTYSVSANDALLNNASIVGTSYIDQYLVVTASPDVNVNTNVPVNISASVNTPSFANNLVKITEVVQYMTGTGAGPYPAYIPTGDNDFIEIVNYGSVPLNLGGFTMTAYGSINGSYTVPANVIVNPQGTLVLAHGTTTNSPANNYYGMGIATTSSTSLNGYVLRNSTGLIVDAVALNGYTFLPASGVTSTDWSGNIPSSSAGVRRTAAVDGNTATDWAISSTTNLMNIGVANTEVTGGIAPPQIIIWSPTGGTANPLSLTFPTAGVYTYTATYNDGTCTSTDDVIITVTQPVTPVANFIATPLTGSAPLNVAFTDLSTNIPNTWAWTVSPMTGVTFVSSTTASSQNPVIQFAGAGTFSVTLLASNSAGSDDTTRLQYITVSICASNATNTGDTDIGNITFGTINNGTATPVLSNSGAINTYTDFTALPVQTFVKGQSYPISLSQITSGTTFYDAHFNVFIDYNNDGFFDVATERVFNGATSSTVTSVSGNVTIPATATLGNVRMRVVLQEGGTATSPACGTYGYGETEDYLINIACPTPTSTTISACGTYVWAANGQTYTTSGVYTHSVGTCPASTLNLTINQNSTATQTAASCVSYLWPLNNMTYTSSGSYVAIVPNTAGCDSIVTLNLTINLATTSSMSVSACSSYTWTQNGTSYSTTGSYVDTILNAAGCDSIITLNLTINQPTASTVSISSCGSYTWAQSGTTYTTSGSYVDAILNAAGCDSIVTLVLTINQPSANTVNASSCGAYTWAQNGMTYSASGMYVDTILNAAGCDSIVTLNLTVNTLNLTVTNTSPTLTSNEVGATYQWINCNGNTPISGQIAATFTATANGQYAVIVTKNNCSDTSACQVVANVGLKEIENTLSVNISPNPTSSFVIVNLNNVNSATIEVMDATGKVVISNTSIQTGEKLDFQNLDRGVYFVKISSEKGSLVERIVKN